jgi:hypothetical protein
MPLTSEDRAKIRFYMGWQSRFFQTDSSLERAMSAVDAEPYAAGILQGLITRCEDLDTKLADADKRQKLGVAEDITFRGPIEIAALRSQGRQTVGRMAALLGVPIRHDVYSASAPAGSNFMKIG